MYQKSIILLTMFLGVFGSGIAWGQDIVEPRAEVWNASKVNWGAVGTSSGALNNTCQVHWLYDDVFDLSLRAGNAGKLYFDFNAFEQSTFVNTSSIITGNASQKAFLVVDGSAYSLAVNKINSRHVTMALSKDLNWIKGAERILFKIGDVTHHFLLENMNESIVYFDRCVEPLDSKKIETISSDIGLVSVTEVDSDTEVISVNKVTQNVRKNNVSLWQKDDTLYVSDSSEIFSSYQGSEVISKKNSYQRVNVVEQGLVKKVEVDFNIKDVEETENVISKKPIVSSQRPQKYDLFQNEVVEVVEVVEVDLNIKNIEEAGSIISKKLVTLSQPSQKNEVLQTIKYLSASNENEIIQNLTKKLSILEKEKEELRLKLVGFAHDGVMFDILACNTQENHVDEPFYNEYIGQLDNTIKRLKVENNLLKGRILSGEPF